MISITASARKKLQEVAESLPKEHNIVWDVVFMGFG